MNRPAFTRQLAEHLSSSEWHFTTLLATCIHCVKHLPDDAPEMIHQLLLVHPRPASTSQIRDFLSCSDRVQAWFCPATPAPAISIFNLKVPGFNRQSRLDLPPIATAGDLASWLDLGIRDLDWLCDWPRRPGYRRPGHYHYSVHPKRNGRLRLIECPKTDLREVQRKILAEILTHAPVHDSAMGFRAGVSCLDHASIHANRAFLVSLDLEHFFQSIGWLQVYRVFRLLGYLPPVAKALTALCTHTIDARDIAEYDLQQRKLLIRRHLPQGAPTSPALSNVAGLVLDRRLSGLAASLKLRYSRYADDLVFSGDCRRNWRRLEALVGAICREEGFALNHRKSRIRTQSQRQRVTGVVVNERPNIDRRYYDALKAELFNCKRSGPQTQNRAQREDYRGHLLGRINYVMSLNEQKGRRLLRLFEAIDFKM